MKSLIIIALLFFVSAALGDIWTSCGTSADKFVISSVTLVPDPPVKGQNFSITVTGTMQVQVTSGTATVKVKAGFITILSKTEPICQGPVVCPIQPGPWKINYDVLIPSDAPNGSFTANAVIDDQTGAELACVDVALKL